MDTVYQIITALGALLILGMTIWGVFSARRERRITAFSSFISAVLSFILLPVFIFLVDVRPNFWAGLLVLGLGLLAGCLGGVNTKLSYRDGQVMGRNSWWVLLLWGVSLVLAQVLNLFGSVTLAAIGLVPMFLTTGTQVGRDGTIFVRRLMIKPPLAGSSEDRTQPGPPSLPETLPERVEVRGQRISPQFAEVERRFSELRARYQAGWMDDSAYNSALHGLMIDDGAGGFWIPADESGGWYWHNGQEWVRRDPTGSSLPPEVGRSIPPQFAEVERRFGELRARYQAGWMDDAAYNAALQALMINDGAGGFWVPADEAGGWYWHNGREWVRRDPGLR